MPDLGSLGADLEVSFEAPLTPAEPPSLALYVMGNSGWDTLIAIVEGEEDPKKRAETLAKFEPGMYELVKPAQNQPEIICRKCP